jgi:hypothetical protein
MNPNPLCPFLRESCGRICSVNLQIATPTKPFLGRTRQRGLFWLNLSDRATMTIAQYEPPALTLRRSVQASSVGLAQYLKLKAAKNWRVSWWSSKRPKFQICNRFLHPQRWSDSRCKISTALSTDLMSERENSIQ